MSTRLPLTDVDALDETFGEGPGVSWTIPGGGLFLPVSLPFEFGAAELERCSRDYGVIVCPMSFFSIAGGRRHQIRLSFSSATPHAIADGVARLGRFVRDELRQRGRIERRPAALAWADPVSRSPDGKAVDGRIVP